MLEDRRAELDAYALAAWEMLDRWQGFSNASLHVSQPLPQEALGALSTSAAGSAEDLLDALRDGWRPVVGSAPVHSVTAVPWINRRGILDALGLAIDRSGPSPLLVHVRRGWGREVGSPAPGVGDLRRRTQLRGWLCNS